MNRGWEGRGGCWVRGFDCFLTALMYVGPGGSTRPEERTDEQECKPGSPKLKQAADTEGRGGFGSSLGLPLIKQRDWLFLPSFFSKCH